MKAWQKSHSTVYKRIPKEELRPARQRSHARRRYEERFGRELSHEEYEDAIAQIKAPDRGYFLQKQGDRVSIWCVTVYGEDTVAMYDKDTHQVRTFYSMEMWESKIPSKIIVPRVEETL